jgi:signal recognition particle subunit SRP54
MFENLQDKLNGAFRTLKGQGRITDVNIATTIKEIRRALMDADVNYKVAKDVTDRVKQEALDRQVKIAVEPGQLFIKIVQEELTALMGGQAQSRKHQRFASRYSDSRFARFRKDNLFREIC